MDALGGEDARTSRGCRSSRGGGSRWRFSSTGAPPDGQGRIRRDPRAAYRYREQRRRRRVASTPARELLNAHLAAHTEKVKQRNADYHRIVKTLFALQGGSGEGESKKAKTGKTRWRRHAGEDGDDDTVSTIDPTRPTPETPSMLGGLIKRKGWSAADGFDLCVFVGDLNYPSRATDEGGRSSRPRGCST